MSHHSPVLFGDQKRVRHWLKQMDAMPEPEAAAFRRIYMQVPVKPGERNGLGEHVRHAMRDAIRYPAIRHWVQMNIALRVAKKHAGKAGCFKDVERCEAALDDFHIATEAYIRDLSIADAELFYRSKQERSALGEPHPAQPLSGTDILGIRTFKQQVVSKIVAGIRRKYAAEEN